VSDGDDADRPHTDLKWQGVPSKDPQIIWIPMDFGFIGSIGFVLQSLLQWRISERSEHHLNEVKIID
jgi:hypothetical protein